MLYQLLLNFIFLKFALFTNKEKDIYIYIYIYIYIFNFDKKSTWKQRKRGQIVLIVFYKFYLWTWGFFSLKFGKNQIKESNASSYYSKMGVINN